MMLLLLLGTVRGSLAVMDSPRATHGPGAPELAEARGRDSADRAPTPRTASECARLGIVFLRNDCVPTSELAGGLEAVAVPKDRDGDRGARVLLVSHGSPRHLELADCLRARGLEVFTARNETEAAAVRATHRPDARLIVLDSLGVSTRRIIQRCTEGHQAPIPVLVVRSVSFGRSPA